MKSDENKQEIINKLISKADSLGRLPKKSDFDKDEVVKIKQFFGPWPHALEQAGLIAEKSVRKSLKKKDSKNE
ncbi:MAG: hypothetical protein IJS17_01600 [Clostridia bacterium]|nr:hypothetical protein [Clostridia bacterium]